MIMRKWDDVPINMQTETVKKYYEILCHKKFSLIFKRIFDIFVSIILLVMLSPVFIIIAIVIMIDSKGDVFFRQIRVTTYNKQFRIFKFRTMVADAEKTGPQVTVNNDIRVTRVGKFLRKYKIDEFPQLLNVIMGDMTLVGTRPEVPKYIDRYDDWMMVTLLLPAGITSEASIMYKDENRLLSESVNPDDTYINEVLVKKMKYNLKSIEKFSFWNDIKTIIHTVIAITEKEHETVIVIPEQHEEIESNNIGVKI